VTAAEPEQTFEAAGLSVRWTSDTDEPVVTITLDRPEVRNAQTPLMWDALADIGKRRPPGTRAVVVRSTGPVFSAGIDLRMFGEGIPGQPTLQALGALPPPELERVIGGFQRAFSWLQDDDVVSIALVQGAAVGAGFQLALSCDLVLCADDARFAMREPSLGLVPDLTGSYPLVRAVGYQRALEICLTGRWVGATEATAIGLALRAVPADELAAAGTELVTALLVTPAPATRATKRLLRAARDRPPPEQRVAEAREQAPLLAALLDQP
jgi:enoyl-CoA hydratase/carnithine racemase